MRETNFMKEMSWTAFLERKKGTNLVIIPTGAFEVYGPHLPLGSDTLVAVKLAEMLSHRVNGLIGPTLEVGDSAMLDEFPGTITIKPESFKAYLLDIVNSLMRWGFKDFLFINAHAGNVPVISQIAYMLRNNEEIRRAQIDFWRFVKAQDQGVLESGETAHSHASEAGTSVMMYLYPDLCDTEKWVNEPKKIKDNFPEIIKYGKLSSNTQSGTVGNAMLATKDKGEVLVQRSLDRIVSFLEINWGIKPKNS